MENKEYLNEENFQKNNKKVKIAGNIVICIGLFLIISAIVVIVLSHRAKSTNTDFLNTSDYYDMSSPDWYEKSVTAMNAKHNLATSQMGQEALGMFLLIPGIFITFVGFMIRFGIGNQREIVAYQIQQIRPIAEEGFDKGVQKVTPVIGNVAKEIAKGIKTGLSDDNNTTGIYCKYCGEKVDSDSTFCKKCGQKLS